MGSLSSHEHYTLLTDYETTAVYTQAFYTLFANIRFHWENAQQQADGQTPSTTHTLLVTSASAYRDRATIAANLAIVAAQSGGETVLVDADLNTPGIEKRFGLKSGEGLSDLLEAGEITPEKVGVRLQPTFLPGLRVLGAGRSSLPGSALLLSPRLEQLTAALREILATSQKRSGIVLFHSGPVLAGADAALLGALTDQTVLTVVAGQTTRAQAKQAQEQLEQAHVKLAGVLMLHP